MKELLRQAFLAGYRAGEAKADFERSMEEVNRVFETDPSPFVAALRELARSDPSQETLDNP